MLEFFQALFFRSGVVRAIGGQVPVLSHLDLTVSEFQQMAWRKFSNTGKRGVADQGCSQNRRIAAILLGRFGSIQARPREGFDLGPKK